MKLLIVESPHKAKSIGAMLGGEWKVVASIGHFCDLPDRELGFAPPEYRPTYVLDPEKKGRMAEIAKLAKQATVVYLATDPDREGEAIAWHLQRQLGLKQAPRVKYQEVSKAAVQAAIAAPGRVNVRLVAAQEARRMLDRLAGYLVSGRISELAGRKGLSAGRVQSPTLRLIVEREREIRAFQTRAYWSISLDSHKGDQKYTAKLVQFQGRILEQFDIPDEARQNEILAELANASATVAKVECKPTLRYPAAPFTTSSLQQDGVRKAGLTTDQVMKIAQHLYEGVDIDGQQVGLITYMRTDACALSVEALTEIRAYIGDHYAPAYLPAQPQVYKSKTANAQEAHEACRPTSILRTPEAVAPYLSSDELALYTLIWKRTLACQMAPARFDTTTIDISAGAGVFRTTGSVPTFPGFLTVYDDQDDEETTKVSKLPLLASGEAVPVDKLYGTRHQTKPPPQYDESSLVKALEEHGIGRPGTYASIIKVILAREYVSLGKKKKFAPTKLGEQVFDLLDGRFAFSQLAFTQQMELDLDRIAEGQIPLQDVVRRFHEALEQELTQLPSGSARVIASDHPCPTCGKALNKIRGKGDEWFWGCSAYPACKATLPDAGGVPGERQPRSDRTGPARHAGDACPTCRTGKLVKRDGRQDGKAFLGCDGFPACRFMHWL
ncbi:type I DNA topoisomerase [Chitinimonas koreensis]|uniref:type I DNA topoisomerase n=1 Tax=Chitinimonas koreensis TaxID=356302 RepID=UPI00041BCF54|nr:type I DNA topoisomerase [Chitinimonas koreensis]QNM95479.1 type I DNA topoisomerase [Chitinimonas koreensis]